MRTEIGIIIIGIIMIVSGLVLFYSIQIESNMDQFLRHVKHAGTFVGLAGIGVVMAGILLFLMSKQELPIQELGGQD